MESVENRLAGIKAGLPKAEFGPALPERFIAQYPPGPCEQMQTQMRIYRIYKTETTFPRCNIEKQAGKVAGAAVRRRRYLVRRRRPRRSRKPARSPAAGTATGLR